jgi:hypothetical protein
LSNVRRNKASYKDKLSQTKIIPKNYNCLKPSEPRAATEEVKIEKKSPEKSADKKSIDSAEAKKLAKA